MTKIGLIVLLMAAPALTSCTSVGDPAERATPSRQMLEDGAGSVDELLRIFLKALEERDHVKLRDLALSGREFEAIVWPQIDSSRPERNLTADFVWQQYEMRSLVGLRRALESFGSRSWTLEEVTFTAPVRVYPTFVLHDDPVLALISDGERRRVMLFGAVIEHEGTFKIYGYSTD